MQHLLWTATLGFLTFGVTTLPGAERFTRGAGDNPTFHSYVIPLTFQKGASVPPLGDGAAEFGGTAPWFTRIQKNRLFHFNAQTQAWDLEFENPLTAFGATANQEPLYQGQSYDFVIYSGVSANTVLINWVSIEVYHRDDLANGAVNVAPVASMEIPVPDPNDPATWGPFVAAGFETKVEGYGLETTLKFRSGAFSGYTWGSQYTQPFLLRHVAGPEASDYRFVVSTVGFVSYQSSLHSMVKDQQGNPFRQNLYAASFDPRPEWLSTMITQPHFASEALPAHYAGKSVVELLAAPSTIPPFNPAPVPEQCKELDASPELRHHPILDGLVADLVKAEVATLPAHAGTEQDALALANYVFNEVELSDPLGFRESTVFSEASIHTGGVSRGALATYMEGQGSPWEQCALLVYMLRRVNIPAVYVKPAPDGMKLLDATVSNLLKTQIAGAVDYLGDDYLEGDGVDSGNPNQPSLPQLVKTNFPWVAAYVPDEQNPGQSRWVHVFPWLKDMEIKEGHDLYAHIRPINATDTFGVTNALTWVKRYLNNDPGILALDPDHNTPVALFPKYIEHRLRTHHPGVRLDEIGINIRQRKLQRDRWGQFPSPFSVTGTPATMKALSENPAIFDTVQVEVLAGATELLDTQPMRAVDLHNRRLLLHHEKASAGTVTFSNVFTSTPVGATVTPTGSATPGSTWDFKTIYANSGGASGGSSQLNISLPNPTGEECQATYTLTSGGPMFSVLAGSGTINLGVSASRAIAIKFEHGNAGTYTGNFRAYYSTNPPVIHNYTLTGKVGKVPSVTGSRGVSFNSQPLGTPVTATARLSNSGQAGDPAFNIVTSSYAGSNQFSISTGSNNPGPGQSRDYSVTYAANGAGSGSITTTFNYDGLPYRVVLNLVGSTKAPHTLFCNLAPFRPSATGSGSFPGLSDPLLNKQTKQVGVLPTQDNLRVKITYSRQRNYTPTGGNDAFLGLVSLQSIVTERPFRRGDLGAVCLNFGRVTPRMLRVHAEEIWSLERQMEATPSFVPTVEQFMGPTAYLFGMSYYAESSRFIDWNRKVHKAVGLSDYSVGLGRINAYRVNGELPSTGQIDLVEPNVDMVVNTTTLVGNGTSRSDSGNLLHYYAENFFPLFVAGLSAEEHRLINRFFNQPDAVSTVRLLQLANAGGQGVFDLNHLNYTSYQPFIQPYSADIWTQIVDHFDDPIDGRSTQFFVTPGPVAGAPDQEGFSSYFGIAALGMAPHRTLAAIGNNINTTNGGYGGHYDTGDLGGANYINNPLVDRGDYFQVNVNGRAASNNVIFASDLIDQRNLSSIIQNANSGYYDYSDTQQQWRGAASSLLNSGTTYGAALSAAADKGLAGTETTWWQDAGNVVYDPVHVVTGEFYHDCVDLTLPSPMPLSIRRNYSSQNLADGAFGYGWKLAFVPFLSVAQGDAMIYASEADGSLIGYRRVGTTDVWRPAIADNPHMNNIGQAGPSGRFSMFGAEIVKSGSTYTLTSPDGSIRTFTVRSYPLGGVNRARPYLDLWKDAHGNHLKFRFYDAAADAGTSRYGQLRRVESSNGNYLGFYYDTFSHIVEAFTGDGRRLHYRYDDAGDLVEVTHPDNAVFTYRYQRDANGRSTHLIVREDKPGGRILENDYDSERRVVTQRANVDALSRTTLVTNALFDYSIPGQTIVTDAYGHATTYFLSNGQITRSVDPLGQEERREWYPATAAPGVDGAFPGALSFTRDKRGLETVFKYDALGNLEETVVTGDLTGDGAAETVSKSRAWYNSRRLPDKVRTAKGDGTVFGWKVFTYDTHYPYLASLVEDRDDSGSAANPGALISAAHHRYYAKVEDSEIFGAPPALGAGQAGAFGLTKESFAGLAATSPLPPAQYEGRSVFTHNKHGYLTASTLHAQTPLTEPSNADPHVTTAFSYNLRGELAEKKDALNRTISYAYDSMGRQVWEERKDEGGALVWWNYQYYEGNGDVEWIDGPRWWPEDYIWFKYDGGGRRIEEMRWRSRAAPDGGNVEEAPDLQAATFHRFDRFGNLRLTINPRKHATYVSYDAIGQVLSKTHYEGVPSGLASESFANFNPGSVPSGISSESFLYEPGGLVREHTDPLGGVTKKFYTTGGALRRQENPDLSAQEWRYHVDGRLEREIYRNGTYLQHVYDDTARTVTKTLRKADGSALADEVCVFDRRSHLISRKDREDHVFTVSFDGLGREKKKQGPATGSHSQQQTSFAIYDSSGKVGRVLQGASLEVKTTADIVGRPVTVEIFDGPSTGAGTRQRVTTYAYSPDHHATTVTEGTGAGAITTTSRTDTFGNVVATNFGVGAPVIHEFDAQGNCLSTKNEAGLVTTFTFDSLDRLRRTTQPDGTFTELTYNAAGHVTARQMPGNLFWAAAYNAAGQMTTQALHSGSIAGPATRQFSYTYYGSASPFAGLIETLTDPRNIVTATAYDDFLRPDVVTSTGALPEYQITTDFNYDRRSILRQVTQSYGNPSVGPPTTVVYERDAYGQVIEESVFIDAALVSQFEQTWDDLGRRSALNSLLASQGGGHGKNRSFAYRSDGALASVTAGGQPYAFAYGDNGLLASRTSSFRTQTIADRDARGRIKTVSTDAGASTQLLETLNWLPDSKLDHYQAARLGQPEDFRDYAYNTRRQLTSETFGPSTSPSALAYQFDFGSPGIGVRTSATLNGNGISIFADNPGGVNEFKRTILETTNGEPQWITTTGNARGADRLSLFAGGTPLAHVTYPGWWDAAGAFSAKALLAPGSHTFTGYAIHPAGWQTPTATRNFTVVGQQESAASTFDSPSGLTISRAYSGTGRVQTFIWDALDRLVRFSERNPQGDGVDETYLRDALNRRVQVTRQAIAAHSPAGQAVVIRSLYDPMVEALEIGVEVDAQRSWLVRGPDLTETYGGLLGCGGLEAIIGEASGQSTGFINDIHGHVVARVSGGAIEWNAARALGYGHAPGATTPPLGSGHPLAHSFGWRGKYRDATGLYCLHLRYYNPTTGRFESPDPLGHAACLDLYSAFNGDPTNYFDPDGRYFRTALTGNSNGSWASTLASTTSQYHPVYGLSSSILGTARNYSANLALHDGRNLGALDATFNPANRGGSGFVEAYQGIGVSGHNVGQSLNNFERAQSAVNGASGLLDTVGLGFGGAGLLRGVSAVAGPSKISSPSVVEPTSAPTVSPSTAAERAPSTTTLTKYWPDNNGFAGETAETFLYKGQKIDRYGGSDWSRFFSPQGTPDFARALPPGTAGQPLRTFEVVKPFPVQSGRVAPAFGQIGGGTQMLSPVKLKTLLDKGVLKEVTP